MDTLDIRIFRELIGPQNPPEADVRKSYRAIAATLRIDADTVRNRVERMKRNGVISGWYVLPNPSLLGVRISRVWVQLPPSLEKKEAIEKVKLMSEVVGIHDCYGDTLVLFVMGESRAAIERRAEQIRTMMQVPDVLVGEMDFPPCSLRLASTDWRIVQSIRRDPRRSYAEISKELGVSPRTVRRRVERMTAAGALFLLPLLRPKALRGRILGDLVVFYEAAAKHTTVTTVTSRLEEFLAGAEVHQNNSAFHLLLDNISRVDEILRWVSALPGVTLARLDILQDRIELVDHLDALVERAVTWSAME